MTTTNLLLLALLVFWIGAQIRNRPPQPSRHKHFTCEIPDFYAVFKIDAVTELSFEVSFGDDWTAGRSFMLYGPPRMESRELPAEMDREKRIGVHIHPTGNWFEQSRIGYIRVYPGGGWECHIALPYQIARHILDDVRRDPTQLVSIGFSKTTRKNGKVAYPIYGIELGEAFD
jgi:hypothetical protein